MGSELFKVLCRDTHQHSRNYKQLSRQVNQTMAKSLSIRGWNELPKLTC